jgi:hypothetical protein
MLTPAQKRTLQRLWQLEPFVVVPTGRLVAHIKTGCNSMVLRSLRAKGAISVSAVYLGGDVAPDLVVHNRPESKG